MTDNKNLPELRDIPEFAGLYAATADGRIYSYSKKKFLSIVNGNNGYKQLCLHKDTKPYMRYLHRLVASAWLPNPDNLPEINHIDANKSNNDVSNLEWCTRNYNLSCRTKAGRTVRPVYCVELHKQYPSITAAAKANYIHTSNIIDCCKHRSRTAGGYHWRYIAKAEKGEK